MVLDDIRIDVMEVEGQTILDQVMTPAGQLDMLGDVDIKADVLTIRGTHLQGVTAGALGRGGLNLLAQKMMEDADVHALVVEGSSRTTGRNPGRTAKPVRFERKR